MSTNYTNNIIKNQKDIDKGQKIVAAVYLITAHLSDSDPIRHTARALVLDLVQAYVDDQHVVIAELDMVLGGAVLAGLISEKNTSIVIYEAKQFATSSTQQESLTSLEHLFGVEHGALRSAPQLIQKDIKKTHLTAAYQRPSTSLPTMSFTKKDSLSGVSSTVGKDSRQEKILSFINERKSAVIKDITALFPEVSEKTIQRELGSLIDTGRITKRGSKRWSMYMAVNSLL